MLTAITDPENIQNAQALLERRLQEVLPKRDKSYTIGYQGGNIKTENLLADHRIWFMSSKLENRYWNAFGLAGKLNTKSSNDIVVEINIPLEGLKKKVAGLFAKDSTGNTILLHRGKIGGGKKGIGKTEFLNWYAQNTVQVQNSNSENDVDEMLLVANLNSPNIAEQISKFVMAVAEFKLKVQEDEVAALTNSDLINKINSSKPKPKQTTVETQVFVRNIYVAEYVKRRAQGTCDLCENTAPFSNADGKPYLECHHIEWLSNGGSDAIQNAVALCPNCHRRMHILKEHEDINRLKKKAKRIRT